MELSFGDSAKSVKFENIKNIKLSKNKSNKGCLS